MSWAKMPYVWGFLTKHVKWVELWSNWAWINQESKVLERVELVVDAQKYTIISCRQSLKPNHDDLGIFHPSAFKEMLESKNLGPVRLGHVVLLIGSYMQTAFPNRLKGLQPTQLRRYHSCPLQNVPDHSNKKGR